MQKGIGVAVAIIGVACLVFGIMFISMSGSSRSAVIDGLAEEGFPVLQLVESEDAYPHLAPAEGVIDTAGEIEDAANVLKGARHAIAPAPAGAKGFGSLFTPSNLNTAPNAGVNTLKFHEYSGIMALEGALNAAQIGLGLADLTQFIGIINIILGIALALVGIWQIALTRKAAA